VRQIVSGNAVPATEGRGATIALGGLDACGLLDRSLVPEVSTAPSGGFNRWSCVLGSAKEGPSAGQLATAAVGRLPAPT
jgi:hypothetical protein